MDYLAMGGLSGVQIRCVIVMVAGNRLLEQLRASVRPISGHIDLVVGFASGQTLLPITAERLLVHIVSSGRANVVQVYSTTSIVLSLDTKEDCL